MERSCYGTRQMLCENGKAAEVYYYLLREPSGLGAEIVMERAGERESAVVRCVTTSETRMRKLAALLYRNSVTPCALRDVIEDELNKS